MMAASSRLSETNGGFVQMPYLVLMLASETNGFDVLLELIKLGALIVTTVAAVMAAQRAGAAVTQTEAATKEARGGRLAAQAAATVAVETAQLNTDAMHRVEQQTQRVEQNTNGLLEAEKRAHAATQAKYEALLAATPPPAIADTLPVVVDQIQQIGAVVQGVVKAHESGVIRIETPRDPSNPPMQRRDDPH